MIEPLTPVVELHSRLGRVGSIQAWDPWQSRQSVAHAKWWVAKIASLSYGNDAAKNPEALFQSTVDKGHHAVLEFVPWIDIGYVSLPLASMRHRYQKDEMERSFWIQYFSDFQVERGKKISPATAFLVECPLYVRSQWMRHRSFSYLEMSRRYTKGSKVEWGYYGQDMSGASLGTTEADKWNTGALWLQCEAEYQRRLDAGWPNEIARGCMPVESMTRFWVCGFDRDWDAFLKLRDDAHAQPEIRVFAQWIRNHLHPESAMDAGNLGT